MTPVWPSYFDPLFQYSGIHPPRFFGSGVASTQCVAAAMRDAHNGVLQWDTIRSLSNCHVDGMDPSPQVNLIFAPEIKVAPIVPAGTGPDMCSMSGSHDDGWHAWGINTPNFSALPTAVGCAPDFKTFTQTLSHEVVEILSDPGGTGFGTLGHDEVGDKCENRPDAFTTYRGFSVARYWSNFDNTCEPRLDPPAGSTSDTWILGAGSPLRRLTGDVHDLMLGVPAGRTVTDARTTDVQLVIQTGGDDLRGGNDNATATLNFAGGNRATVNINQGRQWNNGQTHAVHLALPSPAPRVSDIAGVTISTHFGGGIGGDNWNVDRVALIVSFPTGSAMHGPPPPPVTHEWLNASSNPLVRFTGDRHDFSENVPAQDVGHNVTALRLIISTGNDDLRGGSHAGDNCDVIIDLGGGRNITVNNVNHGGKLDNWSTLTVPIPIPAGGLKGGDVKSVRLHTGFGGGMGGDNWNVNRLQLEATLE
jgi:hypothetical protein